MTDAIEALQFHRPKLAANLLDLERQAISIRADIFHLDAAMAIIRGNASGPRMRAQHLMRLVGLDLCNQRSAQPFERRVRASLVYRAGIMARMAIGLHGKAWRIVG